MVLGSAVCTTVLIKILVPNPCFLFKSGREMYSIADDSILYVAFNPQIPCDNRTGYLVGFYIVKNRFFYFSKNETHLDDSNIHSVAFVSQPHNEQHVLDDCSVYGMFQNVRDMPKTTKFALF